MGGIHHDHVHAGLHQGGDAFVGAGTHAHGGAHPQPALVILAGQGLVGGLLDVLHRHQAAQLELVVHHQHLLDAVLVQQADDLVLLGAFLHGHQLALGGHDAGDGCIEARFETGVAVGDDAYQLTALHHRHAGDVVGAGQGQHLADAGTGADGDGILNHPALELLHRPHLRRLLFVGHVLVHDADAALLGEGNGQACLGDRVHGRRHQRDVEPDLAGQVRGQADIPGQDAGVGGQQEYVVEGEGFLGNAQHRGCPSRGSLEDRAL